ncbi:MAG: hypothetical protein JWQ09_796 [Segetibacter sp.]|nr:hypothetical protein [Segetibacter sp.]
MCNFTVKLPGINIELLIFAALILYVKLFVCIFSQVKVSEMVIRYLGTFYVIGCVQKLLSQQNEECYKN